ncbi:MAG: site-specific integrase [Bdellovibrionales bacterium]
MTYEEIKAVLFNHFSEEREQVKQRIKVKGPLNTSEIIALNERSEQAQSAFKNKDFTQVGTDEEIQSFIDSYSMPIEADTEEFETLRKAYVRAIHAVSRDTLELNKTFDGFNFTTKHRVAQFLQQIPEKKQKKVRLDKSIDLYLKERVRMEGLSQESADGYRGQLEMLLDFMGENASLDISVNQVNEYKELLMNLPKYMKQKKELNGLSLREIAALPNTHPTKIDNLMSPLNVNKYLGVCSVFYEWAVKRQDTQENNFRDVKVSLKKKKVVRTHFNSEQMQKIYHAVLKWKRDEYKWGTLIACFTGARLNEIASLGVEDIKQQNGVWYFDINDEEELKRLKTQNAVRLVPIHSKLIELGFLDYVERCRKEGHARILHQLNFSKRRGYGRRLGDWFNGKLLDKTLHIKTPLLVFHSLRHTVATKLRRANIEDSLIQHIMGHALDDVLNIHYAQDYTIEQKKEAIEKLWPL